MTASSRDMGSGPRAPAPWRSDFDAIVIGAGPAGASAACLLARAGWSVALVEKQRFPRRKVCGECVAASNLPLLDALGIGAAFAASAGPELRQLALLHGEREIVADLPAAAHGRHRWGRALGRETLDTLLVAAARDAGATVLQPWSVQAIDGAAGDWRCTVRSHVDVASPPGATATLAGPGAPWTRVPSACADDELLLRAPVAIAAHGSWEPLPSDRPARRGRRAPSDLLAFKANFRGATLAAGRLPVLAFDGGYGGMVTEGGGLSTLACCIRRDRLEALRAATPGESAGAVVEAYLQRQCGGVRAALWSAVRVGPWLATGPLAPGIHLGEGDGPFRIGNAAGEAHPIIGEGMSMALQSAWLLCAELLREPNGRRGTQRSADGRTGVLDGGAGRHGADAGRHGADAVWQRAAGRRYAAQWRRHFAPRLALAAGFAHLAMRPGLAAPLWALLRCWPGALTLFARCGGKVACAADAATIRVLDASATPAGPASA